MQQDTDDIRATIREAKRARYTIRLTLDDTESFVARTYGVRNRSGGPILSYFDVDGYFAGELPMARITAVENFGRPSLMCSMFGSCSA